MKDLKKATRQQKRLAAEQMRMLAKMGNGRRRQAEDLLDSWRETLRKIIKGY